MVTTSGSSNLGTTGKGMPPGAQKGSQVGFREGGRKPRMIQEGSPEHNLLKEVKVITQGGGHLSGKCEARKREGRSPKGI